MSEILFQYQKVNPTTWVYLSSLLMLGLYFQFNRFWSVRNLDLVLLILLAPGLLMVNQARERMATRPVMLTPPVETAQRPESPATPPVNGEKAAVVPEPVVSMPPAGPTPERIAYVGYLWLFAISLVWLVRLLLDPTMIRRPLLEPNATKGCLLFLGCSLFVFLMANVITSDPSPDELKAAAAAKSMVTGEDNIEQIDRPEQYDRYGPGFYFLHVLPTIPTHPFIRGDRPDSSRGFELVAKTMAISSHLAIVAALILIGYWHFENVKMGIGAGLLYLMLPYTAQMTGHVDHVLPAALLMWAVTLYRRPALAGIFIGLATSVVYYPLFLLPLWFSFYRQRGLARFAMGVVGSIVVMICSLVLNSTDVHSFWLKLRQMFALWWPKVDGLHGIWEFGWDPWFRLPIIIISGVLAVGLAIWPAHKNLGTLLSCSAAVMVSVQFWHGFGAGGGMYMAWYMPLLLMTMFRPNLEDRIALSVLGENWFSRRRSRLGHLGRAA